MSDSTGFLFLLFLLAIYFLPCVVGAMRGVRKAGGIFIVNLAFGWTLVGWIVALVWAMQAETDDEYNAKLGAGRLDEERVARAVASALEAERRKVRD